MIPCCLFLVREFENSWHSELLPVKSTDCQHHCLEIFIFMLDYYLLYFHGIGLFLAAGVAFLIGRRRSDSIFGR